MWSKEEAKELKINFWNGFKRYCSKHKIYRKWVLTGVKIKSTQLKFYADECFQSYRKLMAADCGEDLHWDEDYLGMGERPLSVIYFELKDVNLYHPADWDKIYAFFAEKMPLLEQAYWEYRDLINERIKNS